MADRDKWVLTEIYAESFLGVGPGGITVSLDRPVTVLLGPSGAGKSTILSAIEWALFGGMEPVPDYNVGGVGENVSTHRSVIHLGQDQARVDLKFQRGNSDMTWSRIRSRAKPRPVEDDLHCTVDGQDIPAEPEIVFALNPSLYNRGIAPRQASIRNLVHYERADRNEALDQLFGIETLNDLSVGFSRGSREIGQRVSALITRFGNVSAGLEQPIREQFDRRARARELAIGAGIAKEMLNHQSAEAEMAVICEEIGQSPPGQDVPLSTLKTRNQEISSAADGLWTNPGPQAKLGRLNGIENVLPKIRMDWQKSLEESRGDNDRLQGLVKDLGDRETIGVEIASADEKIELARAQLAAADKKAAVLERAKVWLSEHAHSTDISCPVCQRPAEFSELDEAIDSSLELLQGSDGTIQQLRSTIKSAQENKTQLEDVASKIDAAIAAVDRSAKAALENQTALVDWLRETASSWTSAENLDDPEVDIRDRLQAFITVSAADTDSVDKLDISVRDLISVVAACRLSALGEVEHASDLASQTRNRLVGMQRLIEFLEEDQKMSAMDVMLADPNLADASTAIEKAKASEAVVKILAEIAGDVSNQEATKITDSLAEPLGRWFGKITQHDLLKSAVVTTDVKRSGGVVRNTYAIRATDAGAKNIVSAGHNLSGGYEMVLAVSALCAIQELDSLNHRMDLFMLDEPTESLDAELASAMGTALGLHVPGDRTVITTNRPEFANQVLESAGPARAQIINLEGWSMATGTRIHV